MFAFQIKGNEINNIILDLTPYLKYVESGQKEDVHEKMESLKKNWNDLRNFIRNRVSLIELFLKFHHEAEDLGNMFNTLEQTLKSSAQLDSFYIDSLWQNIQTQYTHLKSIGRKFLEDYPKVRCFH